MNKTAILAIRIISDATKAKLGFDQVAGASDGMAKRHVAAKAALLGLAGAAVKFGRDGVKTFEGAAGSAAKWQRIVGGSVEEASRLNFAVAQSGVDTAGATKGFGILAKNLDRASQSSKGTQAMTKLLGEGFTDAQGKLLPMGQILPGLMDKFAKMPAGPERTALAMKLFGKSGADMLPFLAKGSKGLDELSAKSDAYGNTLTGANLDALKKSKMAQRDWSAALDGVKIQMGAQLLPLLTGFATTLTAQLIPGLVSTAKFLGDNGQTVAIVVGALTGLLGVVKTVTSLTKAWTAVQTVLNVVMAANPIGLIVLAIAALVGGFLYLWNTNKGFRDFFLNAWAAIQAAAAAVSTWFIGTFLPALSAVWNGLVAGVSWLWNAYVGAWATIIRFTLSIPGRILAAVTGFVGLLVSAGRNLLTGLKNGAVAGWTAVATWVGGIPGRVKGALGDAGSILLGAGKAILEGLWNGMRSLWDNVKGWISGIADWIKQHKGPLAYDRALLVPAGVAIMGGLFRGLKSQMPTLERMVGTINATLGSVGADATIPTIVASSAAGAAAAAAGYLVVNVQLQAGVYPDIDAAGRELTGILDEYARRNGLIPINGKRA